MSIVRINAALARDKFLKRPFELQHGCSSHPLFTLPVFGELANSHPLDTR